MRSLQRFGLSPASAANLALRVLMETGIVAGLAYWGVHAGSTTVVKIALGVAAPLVGFGVWGALDFRGAGRYAEPLRLLEELLISGLAAGALIAAGRHALGAVLATVSIVHHVLVYAIGQRLLETGAPVGPGGSVMRAGP